MIFGNCFKKSFFSVGITDQDWRASEISKWWWWWRSRSSNSSQQARWHVRMTLRDGVGEEKNSAVNGDVGRRICVRLSMRMIFDLLRRPGRRLNKSRRRWRWRAAASINWERRPQRTNRPGPAPFPCPPSLSLSLCSYIRILHFFSFSTPLSCV